MAPFLNVISFWILADIHGVVHGIIYGHAFVFSTTICIASKSERLLQSNESYVANSMSGGECLMHFWAAQWL